MFAKLTFIRSLSAHKARIYCFNFNVRFSYCWIQISLRQRIVIYVIILFEMLCFKVVRSSWLGSRSKHLLFGGWLTEDRSFCHDKLGSCFGVVFFSLNSFLWFCLSFIFFIKHRMGRNTFIIRRGVVGWIVNWLLLLNWNWFF